MSIQSETDPTGQEMARAQLSPSRTSGAQRTLRCTRPPWGREGLEAVSEPAWGYSTLREHSWEAHGGCLSLFLPSECSRWSWLPFHAHTGLSDGIL